MKYLFPALGILITISIVIARIVWLALLALEAYDHHNPD